MVKKLSLISVHDYPSRAQYDTAAKLVAALKAGASLEDAARSCGIPVEGARMCVDKWGTAPGFYSVYWELNAPDAKPSRWSARMIDYATGVVVDHAEGIAADEAAARRATQTWVLERIDDYFVESAAIEETI